MAYDYFNSELHLEKVSDNAKARQGYDKKLEGLRGLCAVIVAVTHLFTFNFFGALHTPVYDTFVRLQFAHVAVLIFFIISGYVMGLSHINTPFDYSNVVNYLKKRIVRLYPIYLAALLLTVSLGIQFAPIAQVAGHLFFLQELIVPTLKANPVLWSLSYEFVYYLLFIALWAVDKIGARVYLFLSILLVSVALPGQSINILKSLLIGWVFWLSGLYIARLSKGSQADIKAPIISYFLILIATINLHSGGLIMQLLHMGTGVQKQINGNDLAYLPICTLIVLEITERRFRYIYLVRLTAYFIPAISVFSLFYFRHDIAADLDWIFGIVCFCLAIFLFFFKNNLNYFERLNVAGKISYAIYVFHFPIGFFLNYYLVNYLSGITLLLTGTICWFILTIVVSYLTEIIFQPYIRKYVSGKAEVTGILLKT